LNSNFNFGLLKYRRADFFIHPCRHVTKPGQKTDLTFKLTRPATVFVMATQRAEAPSFLTGAGFKEVASPHMVWRDNDLMLVPAQLSSSTLPEIFSMEKFARRGFRRDAENHTPEAYAPETNPCVRFRFRNSG
jgi:hypothetical protein